MSSIKQISRLDISKVSVRHLALACKGRQHTNAGYLGNLHDLLP
jgi:hypothetical protein